MLCLILALKIAHLLVLDVPNRCSIISVVSTLYKCVLFFVQALKVCVTGAAGQIAYSLLYQIGHGDVFGKDQVRTGRAEDYGSGFV